MRLALHPLGTDYLGRDLLARLMHGARVSLFIGIVAPFFYVLIGILYGSTAGFVGGRVDSLLMRFADFVVALPFLLFMILFKIAFGIGPGESGILPMLVALVLLAWPGHRASGARPDPADPRGGLHRRVATARRQNALPRPAAHDSEHARRHSRDADVRGAERDLHRGVPVVHRHGCRAADAVVGQHVQRRHQDDADASARADLPGAVHSIAVLAFNLLGDGLRDALDARMRSRE